MTETKSSTQLSPRNFVRDILVAIGFVAFLSGLAFWFELRKNRNDFYPTDWLILAPFALNGTEQISREFDYLASDGGEGKFLAQPSRVHKLLGGQSLVWTPYTAKKGEIAFVLLGKIVGNNITNTVGYAQTVLTMPKAAELQLGIAGDDGVKIWINGEVVFNRASNGPYKLEKDLLVVKLKEGENVVLVKNTQLDGGWGFALHFFDK